MRAPVLLSIICLGLSSIVTQIVTLREFLSVFAGNELVIGVILGNWLLLTGLGSLAGRQSGRIRAVVPWLLVCQSAIAVLPPLEVALIRGLPTLLFAGLVPGLGETFLASLVVLSPYCLVSGFLLTMFSGLVSRHGDAVQIGHAYVLDTIGGVAGGVVFSLVLVFFLSPLQTTALLMVLNLGAAAALAASAAPRGKRLRRALPFIASVLLVPVVLWRVDIERVTARALFPGRDLVERQATAYGTLATTRQGDQTTVYENGSPIGSTDDPVVAEETVHYALAQRAHPRVVLLVSGGIAGAHLEVAKYPVRRIDYVELDPAVLELAANLSDAAADPRLRMIAVDARRFVRSKRAAYDAILMALPDPATAQLNRFYTVEFFSEVHRALRPGGVFSFGLSGAENYAGQPVRLLGAAIHRSLAAVFPHVIVFPGARQFFVASDLPLDYDVAGLLRTRGIDTVYVREDYLRAKLTADRIAAATDAVSAPGALNRDFSPVSYYMHLRYWLSQFRGGLLLPSLSLVALASLIAALMAGSTRPEVSGALCSSAFAGMGLEVVLLLAFQICYGYVYHQVGLIVTAFLIGTAAGAAAFNRREIDAASALLRLDGSLAAASFLLAPTLVGIHAIDAGPWIAFFMPLTFPLLNGVLGFLLGAQLPIAARLSFSVSRGAVEKTAGSIYAFDLLGACVGAIFVGVFCVPFLGIAGTCYLTGALKSVSVIALRIRRPRLSPSSPEAEAQPAALPGAQLAFAAVTIVFVGLGLLIAGEDTNIGLYALSFSPVLHWGLIVLLAWGILRAMDVRLRPRPGSALLRYAEAVRASTKLSIFRWTNFVGFAIVVFYPVFRCYFKIPYIFCHVCPRQCAFGFLRPYAVPATLIMNLERRYWCFQACPIGTLYDCQARMGGRAKQLRPLAYVAIATLLFTAVAYFRTMWDLDSGGGAGHDWYTFFFKNRYSVSVTVIVAAAGLLVVAYRLRRAFCNILCPIGTWSDLVLWLERALQRRERRYHGPTRGQQ